MMALTLLSITCRAVIVRERVTNTKKRVMIKMMPVERCEKVKRIDVDFLSLLSS